MRFGLWAAAAFNLPSCVEAADHDLSLQLLVVKSGQGGVTSLDARVVAVHSQPCRQLAGQRLRLSWYFPAVHTAPGAVLRAEVRLRKPWGTKNPGGFDYGLWLVGQGYRASGYLRSATLDDVTPAPVLLPKLRLPVDDYVYGELLNAIALGQREGVSTDMWALFRETGTIHLMVVSGLHVGVFAGFVYLLAMTGLRLITLWPPPWHAHYAASVASLLVVGLLVYQTGLQAPVVRAGLMVSLFIVMLLCNRLSNWWWILLLVSSVALLLQPRMLLQQGFWLSYAAVAVLLFYFAQRAPVFTRVRGFLLCQWVLLIGLSPWLGVTAGEVPLVSPLANLLVVPVMSMLTIPLAMAGGLLSTLVQPLGHACLWLADISLALVIYLLQTLRGQLGSAGFLSWQQALPAIVAGVVLLLPVGLKLRGLALLVWSTALVPRPPALPDGEFRVIHLDVGQGSAAIVDTARHRMLIDAGPAFGSGFDSGASVVIPALRSTGVDQLHRLLISHGDNDHAGGAGAVVARYPAADVIGWRQPCVDGLRWRWEGVDFELFADVNAASRNDASCTLLVSNGRRSAYFSGDIGRQVERRLLPRLPRTIDVLSAPHHGSSTSSSPRFVQHVCPRFVVYSAGRRNRYGHPRQAVMARYQRTKAVAAMTGWHGAVIWRSDRPDILDTWRKGRVRASFGSGICRRRRSSGEFR